ncbi:hypothetical protein KW787_00500 [Candidatus Pacearchaeota archaeon]|nr:hypothetical protein [Candidatus Pacearchaeota archaeon]
MKRGQIAKIISGFPVILSVGLIMAVFIFMSVGLRSAHGVPFHPEVSLQGASDLPLQNIEFQGKQQSVFSALIFIKQESEKSKDDRMRELYKEMIQSLQKFDSLNKGDGNICLWTDLNSIKVNRADSAFRLFLTGTHGNLNIVDSLPASYYNPDNCKFIGEDPNLKTYTFSISGQSQKIQYYYDVCKKKESDKEIFDCKKRING